MPTCCSIPCAYLYLLLCKYVRLLLQSSKMRLVEAVKSNVPNTSQSQREEGAKITPEKSKALDNESYIIPVITDTVQNESAPNNDNSDSTNARRVKSAKHDQLLATDSDAVLLDSSNKNDVNKRNVSSSDGASRGDKKSANQKPPVNRAKGVSGTTTITKHGKIYCY